MPQVKCPNCGCSAEFDSNECNKCGIDFERYKEELKKEKQREEEAEKERRKKAEELERWRKEHTGKEKEEPQEIAKRKIKISILLMVLGLYIPIVTYPFTTPDSEGLAFQYVIASKGMVYEPKMRQLELVLMRGETLTESTLFKSKDQAAIPYEYIFVAGVSLFFAGIVIHSANRD